MRYNELRQSAKTGDIILISGRSIVSIIIRILTGSSVSHVALLAWIDDNLMVIEMREFRGWQITPASIYCERETRKTGATVLFCKKSGEITDESAVLSGAMAARFSGYSYMGLFRVFFSQFISRFFSNNRSKRRVCSTFVQKCWQDGGLSRTSLMTPGDYFDECESCSRLDDER